jgi:hypothetical protein
MTPALSPARHALRADCPPAAVGRAEEVRDLSGLFEQRTAMWRPSVVRKGVSPAALVPQG